MRIFSNISSKNYARTQRVSSKIGTTENVGDYLYDWFTQGTGGPVDVIGSSFSVLENAEEGVIQVYNDLGIEAPEYDSSPVFIPVQSFVHGENEVEQYFFHPDHLGSTSYITNLLGEVSQHMEYFAFGETFVEEHRSSNNSPYKFNGKELDEETGWYYYGARYYDPRISVWLSVDPLANVDYLMNDEAYINGEHNGGVFNSFNHNSYAYTYQNPLRYIDPNGKQNVSTYINGEFGKIEHRARKTVSETVDGIEAGIKDGWKSTKQIVKDAWTVNFGSAQEQKQLAERLFYEAEAGAAAISDWENTKTQIGDFASTPYGKGYIFASVLYMVVEPNPTPLKGLKAVNGAIEITYTVRRLDKTLKLFIPKGFEKVNQTIKGQKIYFNKKDKIYITPDSDMHRYMEGSDYGNWKAAKSIEDIGSKDTRMGTYDVEFNRIDD